MLKYLKLGFLFTKEAFYYGYVFVGKNFWLLFSTFIVYNFVIFGAQNQGVSMIGPIPISLYIWYVFINQIYLNNRKDASIINDVKSGNIITYMNKPVNYFIYLLSNSFLKNLLNIIMSSFFVILVISLIIRPYPWYGFAHFSLFMISFFVGLLTLSMFNIFMGLFAFKFEDSSFLKLILSKAYFILGGAFFPIDIYPHWLQTICNVLPFKYFFYTSANFFVNGNISYFFGYLPFLLFWTILILILNYVFYKSLIKSLEINGG